MSENHDRSSFESQRPGQSTVTSELEGQPNDAPTQSEPATTQGEPAVDSRTEAIGAAEHAAEDFQLTAPNSVPADSAGALNSGQTAETMANPQQPYYSLDPRHIRVEQIGGMIVIGLVSVGMAVGLLIAGFTGMNFSWLWIGCVAAAVIMSGFLFWLSIKWPHVEHRYRQWRWDRDGLEIHRGVYWRHRVSVPISRIQHVDISQGPIQRQFGLATITIHTAGTNEASIELSGLAYETATWLRDQLMTQQGSYDAV